MPPRPPERAVALAEQLRHQRLGRHALGERMAVAAMRAGDPVGPAQMRADADRRRFLADIEMQEAGRLAAAAGGLRHLLEAAEQHHLLVEAQHRFGIEPRRQGRGGSGATRP